MSERNQLLDVDINSIDKIILVQQVLNIDVLAIIPQYNLAIIIEDKTSTSEHGDQIKSYRESLDGVFKNEKPWNAYNKLKNAFKLANLNIEYADIAIYNIHTVYFKTGYYFDYDWQVVHSGSVDNYLTGPMFWDILKNYEDCESDILKSYCTHLKTQLEWYQHVSKINGCYDDKSYYIQWERITQHGLLQIIFDNENIDGSWLWDDMSTYPNEYSTGTNKGGRPWTNRRFWSRTESKAIRSNPPTCFKPWMFWRVDHDSKGLYLSLRYYNNDSSEAGKVLRKRVYDKLNTMINETILNKLETLSSAYNQCVTRPLHGNYYENTLIHIGIEPLLASWDENKGQPFIEWVRDIDCKLRKTIEVFDWEKF